MEPNTRMKILEAATRLFADKGFAAVSIRDVTDAAVVNVSAISYYFSGKEGLYQAVLEEQLAPIEERIALAREREFPTPVDRLRYYTENVAWIHIQRPLLSRFIIGEVLFPTQTGRAIIEEHLSRAFLFLQESLREGVDAGAFLPNLNIAYSAVSLVAVLNFFFHAKPLFQKFVSLPENVGREYPLHALETFLYGILREKPENKT